MLSFSGHYRSWVFDTVEPVCEVGVDVNHLGGRMRRKIVLKLAESAEHRSMTGLLVNRYSDGFFSASWAGEDCGEFLLDDSNYSASSSPQPLTTHPLTREESIFTFVPFQQLPRYAPVHSKFLLLNARERKYSERLLPANFRQSNWYVCPVK